MTYRLVSGPSSEPVTLDDVKSQCRVYHTEQDDLLQSLITPARQYIETITGQIFDSQTWELVLDGFPYDGHVIEIRRVPLIDVSIIEYVDTNEAVQTWSSTEYQVFRDSIPARIMNHPDYSYPSTYNVMEAVRIRFTVGYEDGSSPPMSEIPECLRRAVLLKAQSLYDNEDFESAISSLVRNYRINQL